MRVIFLKLLKYPQKIYTEKNNSLLVEIFPHYVHIFHKYGISAP